MATIRLIEVSKSYQGRAPVARGAAAVGSGDDAASAQRTGLALDQVTLTAPHGQTMAIVGPSGCGKSTLLRVVAGLEQGYSGQVRYDEQPMENVAPGDRHIGMVFQNYALYPHFAGHGNLSFFFRLRKISDQETQERIRITAEMMGLGFKQLLERKPGTLSGGQQQRAAIARALAIGPQVMLFDEPTSSLDPELVGEVLRVIRNLAEEGRTMIMVTPEMRFAREVSSELVFLHDGRIVEQGRPQDVLDHPQTEAARRFLARTLPKTPA